ncbi:hypothetical protein BpHYR1_041322, partial [Brachionus plicatilis]
MSSASTNDLGGMNISDDDLLKLGVKELNKLLKS